MHSNDLTTKNLPYDFERNKKILFEKYIRDPKFQFFFLRREGWTLMTEVNRGFT